MNGRETIATIVSKLIRYDRIEKPTVRVFCILE